MKHSNGSESPPPIHPPPYLLLSPYLLPFWYSCTGIIRCLLLFSVKCIRAQCFVFELFSIREERKRNEPRVIRLFEELVPVSSKFIVPEVSIWLVFLFLFITFIQDGSALLRKFGDWVQGLPGPSTFGRR